MFALRSRSTSSPHGRKLLPAVPASVAPTTATSSSSAADGSSAISIPLPDNHRMDWSALVDTATKAAFGSGGGYSDDDKEAVAVRGAQQQPRRTSVMLNQSSAGVDDSNRTE